MLPLRLAVVAERDPNFLPHVRTDAAIEHVAKSSGQAIETAWLSTSDLLADAAGTLSAFDGLWVAPGSPYRSMEGALSAIRYGREAGLPVLGTCGGCQHMVIEYARNVLGFTDAEHAEYDPYASNLFVTPLSCSLVGQTMPVRLSPHSRVAAIYGASEVEEQYYCNFGLNPDQDDVLERGGLRIVGRDKDGEARLLTIPEHPYFIATLFVPQLTSSIERPHPLVLAFVKAASQRHASNGGSLDG